MKDGVLDGQINLFDEVEEQYSVELAHRNFEAWLAYRSEPKEAQP